MARIKNTDLQHSQRTALIGIIACIIAMFILRPVLRLKAEATFLGGMVGAVLFFFILIWYGNKREARNPSSQLGWVQIGFCELAALVASLIVHPVCITTCFLFSIPVIVYIKWAHYELSKEEAEKKNK